VSEEMYKKELADYDRREQSRTGFLKYLLGEYFQKVKRKETKTQETYVLPDGKLKLKKPNPGFERDNEVFVAWMEQHYPELVYTEIVKKPQWGELKKLGQVTNLTLNPQFEVDGKVVEGVTVVLKAPEFVVE